MLYLSEKQKWWFSLAIWSVGHFWQRFSFQFCHWKNNIKSELQTMPVTYHNFFPRGSSSIQFSASIIQQCASCQPGTPKREIQCKTSSKNTKRNPLNSPCTFFVLGVEWWCLRSQPCKGGDQYDSKAPWISLQTNYLPIHLLTTISWLFFSFHSLDFLRRIWAGPDNKRVLKFCLPCLWVVTELCLKLSLSKSAENICAPPLYTSACPWQVSFW